MKDAILEKDIQKVIQARHNAPHTILGPHCSERNDAIVIRALIPYADRVSVLREDDSKMKYQMDKMHEEGFFEVTIPGETSKFKYRFHVIDKEGNTLTFYDPYAITSSTISDFDRHLFAHGNHYHLFEKLGAHPMMKEGIQGVNFALWAPNAERVSVVAPFNNWDGRCHQMGLLAKSGIWEIFIPGLSEGEIYKYEIRAGNGDVFLKSDPYAFYTETPPETASIIYKLEDKHIWNDGKWMKRRADTNIWELPVSIYEVHLGSWMKTSDNKFLSYRELAAKLVHYVRDMGFTHIELMPIAEHPYAPSWGYQVSNFFAPTSRYGKPEDLMAFVDICHQNSIGVILDWVPAHFPKDAHALAWFDGTCLYEHEDPRKGEHRDWGTLIFNYGRHEIENFLIASALFWLKKYHFDGMRIDAVASMLYLDYSRKEGEWIPNKYGGNENLEAVEFLKHTNSIVHKEIPGVMMIAEESTAWPGVSRPINNGGLGFGFKWNMGWMHDVLLYMSKETAHRKYHHNNLTFGLIYAFNENFILSLSHDEVVHQKGSLINKMSGDEWQKFANLRLLYTFMYAHPGKKLLFMGAEFGQWSEWDHSISLEWHLLNKEPHKRLQLYVGKLNRLYRSERAFYEVDFKGAGFEWIYLDKADENVIVFMRKGKDPRNCLFFAMNFSPVPRENFRMGVPFPVFYTELLNSDATEYWGSGKVLHDGGVMAEEIPCNEHKFSLSLLLPPLGAVILKPLPPETWGDFEITSTGEKTEHKQGRERRRKKHKKKRGKLW
ncbi:MAG: 1,4-alpha-glucan branching protein GlgB [Candidatus Scalindua sp.]